ncbi:hypothetical protein [Paenibacillus sp. 7541]|uniref:hypothetical protein n=1 Tax=Paenibacillus sp. 7541 TaxID=2026236 RepID=UPI000BA53C3A|nr:hypothetical protein [Paenibacillus sp. 7541]PAK55401.1 hypothetical protein CHH75_03935 [Paenibacillus sp. 7541]
MKCCQCDKQATVEIAENLFCNNCFSQLQSALNMQHNRAVSFINYQLDQVEAIAGVPGLFPRYKTQPTNVHTGDYIYIDKNSIVGSIKNMGYIDKIEISLNNNTDEKLAKLMKQFTESVLISDELSPHAKDEIIEQLSFISDEVNKPKPEQKQSVIKSTAKAIKESVSGVNMLYSLWENIQKIIAIF